MRVLMHNTPEEVRGAVAVALEVLDDCDVPEDLRAVAFSFVAAQTLAKQIFYHAQDQAPLVESAVSIPSVRH